MRTTLHGSLGAPVVATVGTWDPFLPEHANLFASLVITARARSCASLAVLLHPHPATLLVRRDDLPSFDDVETRVRLIRACGVDAVLVVRFCRRDVDAGAAELFEVIRPHARLAELWLGAYQSLGRGPAGGDAAVSALAAERAFAVVRLPPVRTRGCRVIEELAAGRLGAAVSIAGRAPVRGRPRTGLLRLDWRPGRYHARRADAGGLRVSDMTFLIDIRRDDRGRSIANWPDRRARYLAFVGDEAAPPAAVTSTREEGRDHGA